MSLIEKIYKQKNDLYFNGSSEDLIALIPTGDHRILDVGCANGNTGFMLKKTGKAKEVVGIEINEPAVQIASSQLDRVILGNIEEVELPFAQNYFDYILCGDVLEHLIDPWQTLKKLGNYLSPNGFLIASIPNIRYWKVLKALIWEKKWEYTHEGILDRGHLRFFSYVSILDLFHDAGFRICKIFDRHRHSLNVRLFNVFTFNRFCDIFTLQYIVIATMQTEKYKKF